MKGIYSVKVRNNRNSYSFELRRNITILRGESGRGKTTLFDMISDHNRFGKSSGVALSCDKKIIAIGGEGWQETIEENPDSIIVLDEDSSFIRSEDFARVVRGADNYFLLITRNYLSELPISVDEIYELSGSNNKKFKRIYQNIERMFDRPSARLLPFVPEVIITEDQKSGFKFFESEARKMGIMCVSAGSKSQILACLQGYLNKNVVVVADGAAFGSEISDIVEQQCLCPKKLAIFLPESFEWLILKSGVVNGLEPEQIDHPELYADSRKYMSWEQYFTDMLIQATKNNAYMKYKKSALADYYLQPGNALKIKNMAKGIRWEQ